VRADADIEIEVVGRGRDFDAAVHAELGAERGERLRVRQAESDVARQLAFANQQNAFADFGSRTASRLPP